MRIHAHHDADGISAVAMYILANNYTSSEVAFPEIFGEFAEDTKVMIDMYPNKPDFTGLVIDHHPDIWKEKKFQLIHSDIKPASLLVYELYKDRIPQERWWYVAIGLAGDVSDYLIPIEVHERFPVLRRSVSATYRYGNIKELPFWKYLSGIINAYCKVHRPNDALNLLLHCEEPYELFEDEEGWDLKRLLHQEIQRVERDLRFIEIADSVLLSDYYSDYNIGGTIASRWHANSQKTIILVNRRDFSFNIRGELTYWIIHHLKRKFKDISVGGHPQAAGGIMNRKIFKKLINEGLMG